MTQSRRAALIARGLAAVKVMPDYMADAVWAEDSGDLIGALRLDDLDLSDRLTTRLRAWQQEWEAWQVVANQGAGPLPVSTSDSWLAQGRKLAFELKDELGGQIPVRYAPVGGWSESL